MSQFASAGMDFDAQADRRKHVRRPQQRQADLLPRGEPAQRICTILDASDGGVQVEIEDAETLPDDAIISFSDSASQLVRRCWASGNRAGYQYIEMVPVQRHWLQDNNQLLSAIDFLALNNFVAISRTLLNLFTESPDCLYSIEQVCARLAALPHARVRNRDAGPQEQVLQLISIPQPSDLRSREELVSLALRLSGDKAQSDDR
jgi:hypothetical protein